MLLDVRNLPKAFCFTLRGKHFALIDCVHSVNQAEHVHAAFVYISMGKAGNYWLEARILAG